MEKKATVNKEKLSKTIGIANRFIQLRPSLPVLGNVLLEASKGNLNISATNLETSVLLEVPSKEDSTFEVTIPAKIFSEILNTLSETEVTLELDKETLVVQTDTFKGSLSGIAATEFPKLPQPNEDLGVEFSQEDLEDAVNKVNFAASSDEGKPILTGVLLRSDSNKTIVVATDGYRLAKKELEKQYKLKELLISAKTLTEVLKISGELGEEKLNLFISQEDNQAIFSGDNFKLTSRLLSGTYPNFTQIIPTNFVSEIVVNRNNLISAIRSASVFARDIGNVVKLTIKKTEGIIVSADTAQIGSGESKLDCNVVGEDLNVAFNSKYLLDGLNTLKAEEVEISFSGALSPALIKEKKDSTFMYIVMPVKPQN